MKRMESKIALTFAIMFVVGFIINGIYSVITMGANFFTFEVMSDAIFAALFYLFYVWIYSRKHKLLTIMGVVCIGLMLLFAEFSVEGVAGSLSGWNWKTTVMLIYYITASGIADYQANKLLEESKETVNIKLTLKGDIKPEDVEITID